MYRFLVSALLLCSLVTLQAPTIHAEELSLSEGKITLTPPEGWKKKTPSVRIIDFEYEVPAAEGDEHPGRMTIMGAGGGVEANVARWVGQFELEGDAKPKIEEGKIAGQKVHKVDISGTYKDQPGPFAPAVKRENYRMLAAIIATEKDGQYFVKFYGPATTVEKNQEAFNKMIDSLQVK